MAKLGPVLALGAAITFPQSATGHLGDITEALDLSDTSHVQNIEPQVRKVPDYKSMFLDIIEGVCTAPERARKTPEGYTYYPSVGFQLNTMANRLMICNGGIKEPLGTINMKIHECGVINATQESMCTLLNENGGNETCLIASPEGNLRMERGTCREVFPPEN